MADNEHEQDQAQAPELSEKEQQASFEQGFINAASDDGMDVEPQPPKSADKRDDTPAAEPEKAQANASPEPGPVVFGGLTEEQLKNVLAKATEVDDLRADLHRSRDKLAGKLGEITQKLNELREAKATTQEPQATPAAQQKIELKRLAEEYPDLAEALAQDLAGASLAPQESTPQEQPNIDSIVEERVTSALADFQFNAELNALTARHPDWQTIRDTADFKIWDAGLGEQERQALWGDNAAAVSAMLDRYKARGKPAQKQPTRRLARAVQPRGVPTSPAPTDEEAFVSGFKRARG